MHSEQTKFIISTVALILVGGLVGYVIYTQKSYPSQSPPTASNTPIPEQTPPPSSSNILRTSKGDLALPTPDATQEEIERFIRKVEGFAAKTELMDVSGCKPNPDIAELKAGKSLTLGNKDTVAHTISFRENPVAVPPQGETTSRLEFIKGPGVYGFGCDNSAAAVGFLVITE